MRSDSSVDSDIGPAVDDSKGDSKVDPVIFESEVGLAVVENNERCHPKPKGKEYRSKPKREKGISGNGETKRKSDGKTNHTYLIS